MSLDIPFVLIGRRQFHKSDFLKSNEYCEYARLRCHFMYCHYDAIMLLDHDIAGKKQTNYRCFLYCKQTQNINENSVDWGY